MSSIACHRSSGDRESQYARSSASAAAKLSTMEMTAWISLSAMLSFYRLPRPSTSTSSCSPGAAGRPRGARADPVLRAPGGREAQGRRLLGPRGDRSPPATSAGWSRRAGKRSSAGSGPVAGATTPSPRVHLAPSPAVPLARRGGQPLRLPGRQALPREPLHRPLLLGLYRRPRRRHRRGGPPVRCGLLLTAARRLTWR